MGFCCGYWSHVRSAAAASRRGGRTPPDIRPATAPGPSPRRIRKGWVEEAWIALARRVATLKTFEQGALGDDLPTIEVPAQRLNDGIPAYELFRETGLAASNGEARRLIKGGGGRINDDKIESETATVGAGDLKDGVIKLSAGKKRHALVRAV